jgi:hypothetical protein
MNTSLERYRLDQPHGGNSYEMSTFHENCLAQIDLNVAYTSFGVSAVKVRNSRDFKSENILTSFFLPTDYWTLTFPDR